MFDSVMIQISLPSPRKAISFLRRLFPFPPILTSTGPRALSTNRRDVRGWVYLFLLIAINVYICRESFYTESTGYYNSVHGGWMALARLAGLSTLLPAWWALAGAGVGVSL